MVDMNESFGNLSVGVTKVETTNYADRAEVLDALSPCGRIPLVGIHRDLEDASLAEDRPRGYFVRKYAIGYVCLLSVLSLGRGRGLRHGMSRGGCYLTSFLHISDTTWWR